MATAGALMMTSVIPCLAVTVTDVEVWPPSGAPVRRTMTA